MSRTTVAVLTTAALLTAHASFAQSQATEKADKKGAVQVEEQNVDVNGDIKVHDSGTVAVKTALDAVQVTVFGSFPNGGRFSDSPLTIYTVPEGKVLVIDALTVASNMSAVDHLMDANFQLTFNGSSFSVFVQPVAEGVFTQTNAAIFRKTDRVTAYAGPGTRVNAVAIRDGANLSGTSVLFALAGHLVDAPQ